MRAGRYDGWEGHEGPYLPGVARPRDVVDEGHSNRRRLETERSEAVHEFASQRFGVETRRRPQRDVDATRGLPNLVLEDLATAADRRAEHVRVDFDTVVGEDVVAAAFDVGDAASGPRAGVRLVEHRDLVGDLVADEGEHWLITLVTSSLVARLPGATGRLLASTGS